MIDKMSYGNHILRMLIKKLQDIKNSAEIELNNAKTVDELYQLKVKFFGKQGALTLIMKDMGDMPKEERPIFGKEVNLVRDALTQIHDAKSAELSQKKNFPKN